MNINFVSNPDWQSIQRFKEGDVIIANSSGSIPNQHPHILLILNSGQVFHLRKNETGFMGEDQYRGFQWRKVDAKMVITL